VFDAAAVAVVSIVIKYPASFELLTKNPIPAPCGVYLIVGSNKIDVPKE
jgi:hypothetical protein